LTLSPPASSSGNGGVSHVQHLKPVRGDLHLAGGQRGIHRALRPRHHLAADRDHRLGLEVCGLRAEGHIVLRVELHLREALAVAQVDEDDAAVVADGVHPAQQRDGRAEIGLG
jgi:hypothetical protein